MPSSFLSKLLIGLVGALVIALAVSIFTATTASTNFFYTFADSKKLLKLRSLT